MTKRWLVTGCSSGLGRALAARLAAEGEQVVATARRPETLDGLVARHPGNVVAAALDVRDAAQCAAAIGRAVDAFGGVDVLVNNAAYGQFGTFEEVSDAELAAQFDTNVFGPWRLTQAVLPLWRAQRRGHAVFVSSVAGVVPFPGLAAYTASKFAVEGAAESLAAEAGHLGVKVTILQPGGFATDYSANLVMPQRRIADYAPVGDGMLAAVRGMNTKAEINSPELFADVVWRLGQMESPPLRLPVGTDSVTYLEPAYDARRAEYDQVVKAGQHILARPASTDKPA
ncbi:oxidoreductase [Micromonospora sp. ATCC 39149]|uniref:SDR family oxidoreductase n=1 Tax=Micromonospora carbonacea TaxID=47853 RepID=A0A7D6GRD8_9ACTN|nr:SDR family oxidoreductase [Micromonospora sp. ATCC 39149]EEP69746.1 oxidoreductase [Micromonospora sp. ATCC 39149]QLK01071.1 SDR family oxidoreductase [Micromonospora carbonacea]